MAGGKLIVKFLAISGLHNDKEIDQNESQMSNKNAFEDNNSDEIQIVNEEINELIVNQKCMAEKKKRTMRNSLRFQPKRSYDGFELGPTLLPLESPRWTKWWWTLAEKKKEWKQKANEATYSRVDALETKFDVLMALVKNSIIGNQIEKVEGQSPSAKEVEGSDMETPKAKKRARSNTIAD
uniref:Uncharacterized protein n=1 Tax=Romanomermis culicivorax TaxID=13658 RepID=A0A915JNH5_ROMCU